ncbi:SHOCT domain-containing protein [Paraburkholderia fungorum]|uniref:SHOCT domain-containing protein n=1 Tax=Paraburkholderia fungorum TaxID=134537 RepID=UPI0038B8E135
MQKLTPAGQQLIEEVAQRHGFSTDAVMSMLESVIRGNGSMAQFNHPEFGGSGQWMQGGMTMVSDMFNHYLKGRVDGLCFELSRLIANQPDLIRIGSFQSQSQVTQQQTAAGPVGPVSLFVPAAPGTSGDWWPAELGAPNSTGAQNDIRYAFFAHPRRLAIEVNGKVTVYDTRAHQISGFSQQQSRGASLTFASQHGLVAVASLPVVSVSGVPQPASPPVQEEPVSTQSGASDADVFATIEKLAQLHAKGILSDEEFAAKKAELLSRL